MTEQSLFFHHIGVATKNLDQEMNQYLLLGYKLAGDFFEDPLQGIRGCFLEGEGPRIELLENLTGATTLTNLNAAGIKMYHLGYTVGSQFNLDEFIKSTRAIMIRPPLFSVAFQKNICFLTLRNKQIIELIGI